MLAVVALGAGAIAVLALAWSAADGPLRLELQSTVPSPRTVAREAAAEEVDRLRRQMDGLENEIRELTHARQQAADAIAALQTAVQEARNHVPPPVYWYSIPAALNVNIASQPEPGGAASGADRSVGWTDVLPNDRLPLRLRRLFFSRKRAAGQNGSD